MVARPVVVQEQLPSARRPIRTLPGVGYMLLPGDEGDEGDDDKEDVRALA